MKKLIAVCIVLMLCLSAVAASADNKTAVLMIDWEDMTIEELVWWKNVILSEIHMRDEYKSIKVPSGQYIVGEDIPEGVYSILSKALVTSIMVNDENGSLVNMYTLGAGDKVGKIILTKGQTIEIITAESTVFTTYTGLDF